MKLREKIKRFWTLDVHGHEGFTLVELIIVIAILAILSSVAVVGYSSYVTKANMQADKTMIAEIENALVLAYYSGTLTADGYVILSDGKPDTGDNQQIEAALEAAYGSGWENLVLKYDGWTGGSSADVIAILYKQGAEAAAAVAASTYAENVSQMLNDAQNCTGALAHFLGEFVGGDMEAAFTKLSGNSEGLEELLVQAGLAKLNDDGLNYDLVDAENTTETQLSNAVILAIAGEVTTKEDATDKIAAAWQTAIFGGWPGTGMSLLADTAARYACYESVVGYLNDSKLNEAFATMNKEYNSATSQEAVLASMTTMNVAIAEYASSAIKNEESSEYKLLDQYMTKQLYTDAAAFASVMGAVNGVSDDFATSENLSKDEMYLSENVTNAVNSYVSAAKNFGQFPASVEEGTVLIIFSMLDGNAYSVPAV